MHRTPTPTPSGDRSAQRSRRVEKRRNKRGESRDAVHLRLAESPIRLGSEHRGSGTALRGPNFYVWDEDEQVAVGWAQELACALPMRGRPDRPDRSGGP